MWDLLQHTIIFKNQTLCDNFVVKRAMLYVSSCV